MTIKVVIMDIDDTLANAEHRLHLLPTGKAPSLTGETVDASWDAFFAAADKDTPNEEIVQLSNALADRFLVFVVTGRREDHREMTAAWLTSAGVIRDRLYMRPAGDRRPDTVVKKEILDAIRAEGFEVSMAIEDRKSVVEMWRANGVRCLAVCEGNY